MGFILGDAKVLLLLAYLEGDFIFWIGFSFSSSTLVSSPLPMGGSKPWVIYNCRLVREKAEDEKQLVVVGRMEVRGLGLIIFKLFLD
jgi:hypothetical protein